MLKHIQDIRWGQATPRMLADLIIVQFSMISALALSAVYTLFRGYDHEARALVTGFSEYYPKQFVPLSPIFVLVFLGCGFYTQTRGYADKYKWPAILRGVALSIMLFLITHYVLLGYVGVGRSVILPFAVFSAIGLAGVRLLKAALESRYTRKPSTALTAVGNHGRVLVVGGAGYIGSMAVERLLNHGYAVRVLDSLLYGDAALRGVKEHPRFELQVGDCRNIQDVVRAVRGVDSILHLAAIVGDPACEQDPDSALEINYAATRMLVEVAKGNGVSRFVFASSCSVYGATELEVDEKAEVRPISLYGRTKVDSEEVVLQAGNDVFHPTVLRFATVFGLGYRPRFDLVVNLLTAKARQEHVITIYNGTQWRPFIHVRDVAEATVRIFAAPVRVVSGEIFNVGDSRLNCTLSGLAECIQTILPDTRVERRDNSDLRNYRVNFDKLRKSIGFEANYTLRDGVEELKRAFDEGTLDDYMDVHYHNQRYLKASGNIGHKDELDGPVMAAFSGHPNHAVLAGHALGLAAAPSFSARREISNV